MPDRAYETWPAVRRIVDSAAAEGLRVYEMLADVEAHARRHQLALTFHDAAELAREFHCQLGIEEAVQNALGDRASRSPRRSDTTR